MIFPISFDIRLINKPENTCSSNMHITLGWYSFRLSKNRLYLLMDCVSINSKECRNKEFMINSDNRYIKQNKINNLKLIR